MDSELFTVGGGPQQTGRDWSAHERSLPDGTQAQVWYQAAKLMRSSRWCAQALYWLFVFLTIYVVVTIIPLAMKVWKDGLAPTKSDFTQKENLQYLGASTSVVRDDTGWASTDSLAEQAMRSQQETNMAAAPAKAGFRTERMTPEEKLLEQQKK